MSDTSRHRVRGRIAWLWCGGVGLALAFPVAFLGLAPAGDLLGIALISAALLASATCYAAYQSSYLGFAAEVTTDEGERTRLMARRTGVIALTTLVVGGVAPAVHAALPGPPGFRSIGIAAGLMILVGTAAMCLTVAAPASSQHKAAADDDVLRPRRDHVRAALRIRPFRLLLLNYALQGIGTGASLSALLFVATHVVDDPGLVSSVFVSLFVAAMLSIPVWERVGLRTGKRPALALGSAIYVVANVSLLAVGSLADAAICALSAVAGIGYAAMQVFPAAMLPDVTTEAAARSGEAMQPGLFGGIWTSVESASVVAGSALFAAVLGVSGYQPAVDGHSAGQSARAMYGIVLGFAAVPALAVLLSLLPLARYRLAPASGVPANGTWESVP